MLRVENLEYRAGNFHFGPLNLGFDGNEYFVLLGPTGSGKSMFLGLICGLTTPLKGSVYFNNLDITKKPPEKRNFGFVTQQSLLFPHLNVFENIAFSMRLRKFKKKDIKKRVDEVSELTGIRHLLYRNVQNLSGGEAQRVAIARAIAVKPDMLIFDEPMSALDKFTRKIMQSELKKLQRELNIPVIHVTHDFEEAVALAHRISIIHEGKIVQSGLPEDVFRKPASRFVAEFVGIENIFKGVVKRIEEGRETKSIFETGGVRFHVVTDREGECFATLRANEIILSGEKVETSALNNFVGNVVNILQEGALFRVTVDIGVSVNAVITAISLERLGIRAGSRIHLLFKASSVHII
jgi:molybdopterin-binding protein